MIEKEPAPEPVSVRETRSLPRCGCWCARWGRCREVWRGRLGRRSAALAYGALGRLRRVGLRNLELAFPEMSDGERERILREVYRNLGWLLAEFCLMPGYTAERASRFIRYEGLENYLGARDRGQGCAGADGAPGGVGAFELLSLADGVSRWGW